MIIVMRIVMRTVLIGTHLAARFLLKCETFRIVEIPQLATQTKLRFNSTIYLTARSACAKNARV